MKKWECTVCGYIHEGDEPPDECPVCSADKSMFVEITAENVAAANAPQPAAPPESPPTAIASLLERVSDLIVQYHLHPITVHTPNGIVPMAVIFFILAAIFEVTGLETAALLSLIFVLIAMPAVLFTGYTIWQRRYKGAVTPIFKLKIGAAIVATVSLLILVIWRATNPDIIMVSSSGRWLFLLLSFVLLAAVGLAGHMGGKLVFGTRKD